MKLKNHPTSKKRPVLFDDLDYVSKNGSWDPEHWHNRTASAKEPKRSASSSAVGSGNNKEDQQEKVWISFNSIQLCPQYPFFHN